MAAGLTPLSIQTTYPKVQINRQMPRVKIDQYECFRDAGLKNNADFSADSAAYSYKRGMEGIGNIVDEGNRLQAIENGNFDVICDIAFESGLEEVDYNVDIIPKSRPKIEVEGSLNIEYEMGKVNFYKESMLEYKYRSRLKSGKLVDMEL